MYRRRYISRKWRRGNSWVTGLPGAMSEKKRRASLSAKILATHPRCCFCGGTQLAKTIDHLPAKIIFSDKQRPKGREFPACLRCNNLTSLDESVLAFVCRMAGSSRDHVVHDDKRLNDILRTIRIGFPGLLDRMNHRARYLKKDGIVRQLNALNVNQPEIHSSLCRIAAKLALAESYERNGAIASDTTRIKTMWIHSLIMRPRTQLNSY